MAERGFAAAVCPQHPDAPMLERRCESTTPHIEHIYAHAPNTYGSRCWVCPGAPTEARAR